MKKKTAYQLESVGEKGFLIAGALAILLILFGAGEPIVWVFVLLISMSALLLATAWTHLNRCTLRGLKFTKKDNPISFHMGLCSYYLIGVIGAGISIVRLIR